MNTRFKLDPKIFRDAFEANWNPAKAAELAQQLTPMRRLVEKADRAADVFIQTLLKGETK